MPQHILIGPGNFGLGFSGDLFARVARIDTTLIGRIKKNKSKKESATRDDILKTKKYYYVSYKGKQTRVDISGFFECDFFNPSDDILSLFTDSSLKLVTIAVPKPGLDEIGKFLSKALDLRISSKLPLPLVLTFVNTHCNGRLLRTSIIDTCSSELTDRIKDKGDDSASFPDCVIDRICSDMSFVNEELIVNVERYASLIVTKSNATQFLEQFKLQWKSEYGMSVLKRVPDTLPWHCLKIWGLNGLHLLLASVAHTPIYEEFQQNSKGIPISDIVKDSRVTALIHGFTAEVSIAIRSEFPKGISRDDTDRFFSTLLNRLSNTNDTDARLLQQLRLDEDFVTEIIRQIYNEDFDHMLGVPILARRVIDESIGDFLKKVNERTLDPTFQLSGKERVYPMNLMIASSCILYAIAKQSRKQEDRIP